ncbi:MAG TPA: CotH kinase family protein [Verrucomicrobiae bacterium]|nr:CotH kinase family protein [Verrucomicrobiae bacterium]
MRTSPAISFFLGLLLSQWLLPAETATRSDRPGDKSSASVQIEPPSGYQNSPFSITLSSPVPRVAILFTTNGTDPDLKSGIRYQHPISIKGTTIIQAAGFLDGAIVGRATARTYLFIPDILRQRGDQFPANWGTNGGRAVPASYAIAEDTAQEPASRSAFVEGIKSLPTLSLIADPEKLFGGGHGIYSHPMERGSAWECSAAVEMVDSNGDSGFNTICGLRIHGASSRSPEESPKHSFRLRFRRRYGLGELNFPLFGKEKPAEFDTLILRAGNNNSWLHSDGTERQRADYLRDQWMRDTLRAMGYPAPRGAFVHLYLNGLYWGVYNLCESPGPGFEEKGKAGYDFRKGAKTKSGDASAWETVLELANSGLTDERNYQSITNQVDLAQFADFMILNFYAGNTDWDRSANWYAVRPRAPAGKFRFFVWDAERSLEDLHANTLGFDDDESPARLFQRLSENDNFRRLFAERVRQWLLGDGVLAPGSAAERYRILARNVEKAMAAEAARWGNYRRRVDRYKTGPYKFYTVAGDWQPEVDRLLTQYFPQRTSIVLDQFRERGIFPVEAGLDK